MEKIDPPIDPLTFSFAVIRKVLQYNPQVSLGSATLMFFFIKK